MSEQNPVLVPEQVPAPPSYYGAAPALPPYNAYAITAFVLAFFTAIVAIPFGHVALHQLKRDGGRGRWMAITGLAVGYAHIAVSLAVLFAVVVIAVLVGH